MKYDSRVVITTAISTFGNLGANFFNNAIIAIASRPIPSVSMCVSVVAATITRQMVS